MTTPCLRVLLLRSCPYLTMLHKRSTALCLHHDSSHVIDDYTLSIAVSLFIANSACCFKCNPCYGPFLVIVDYALSSCDATVLLIATEACCPKFSTGLWLCHDSSHVIDDYTLSKDIATVLSVANSACCFQHDYVSCLCVPITALPWLIPRNH